MKVRISISLLILVSLSLILTGCNMPGEEQGTPTLDSTQAFQTVQARLTEAVALTPSPTITPMATETPSPSPTAQASPTARASATLAVSLPSPSAPAVAATCNQASPGSPIDVTIPDDTQMAGGQAFTKTWRLRNSGTCTWTTGYALVYFSGEKMGAPNSVAISADVAPNQTIDLSVDMVAPTGGGTYQSNWKLRNASGTMFGIGPGDGLPFYVRIVVGGAVVTGTVTPTATGQAAATVTPTPSTAASGTAMLFAADAIDLDTNQVNSGGADLQYQRNDADSLLYLTPAGSTTVSVFGGVRPTLSDCQAASLSNGALNVANLTAGVFLCYRTGEGRYGWAQISGYNAENTRLDLSINTWVNP